ncbi:MAG: tetratricopeptide repeat protein [Proteobacteria bacterium]|nr:tetratricopeptide repeat protein [Pseudomonadota bacterium]MBS0572298.1 tetratricopeptide repeat protein [Pseudomonadota bacterium]
MSYLTQFALMVGLALPGVALAAGGGSSSPPQPTQTTTKCKKAEVWDQKTQKCVPAQSGQLDNDTLYAAARELAYAGRPDDALVVLQAMTEGQTDRVLTYMGFANRKAGRMDEGMKYYQAALAQNPDNILARSYMGQAYVQMGNMQLADAQLDEIVARGGAGTWAEQSLRQAIQTGALFSY